MATCPCNDCEFRHPGCHGSCEPFKTWKAPLEAMRLQRIKDIPVDTALHDGIQRRNKRWMR